MNDPQALLNVYLDRELTDDQHRALMAWLAQEPGNVDRFVMACFLHSQLQDHFTQERLASEARALRLDLQWDEEGTLETDDSWLEESASSGPPVPASCEDVVFSLDAEDFALPPLPILPGVGNAVRRFSQVGVMTYVAGAVAVLMLCLGVQLAWEWKASGAWGLGSHDPSAVASAESGGPTAIGHITGMSACRWGAGAPRLNFYAPVFANQKIDLEAGLLEITHRTGFKAILHGPVRYTVTSSSGGFLSVGRLTGHAPTPRARGFVVNMPAASVTDLGTEFGVEVATNGMVETVVFAGAVKLEPKSSPGHRGTGQILRRGQAAQVLRSTNRNGTATAARVRMVSVANPHRFTRALPPVPVHVLISPTDHNGSFEEPAVGPEASAAEASDPAAKVSAQAGEVAARFWNPTHALRTKGMAVRGVTGEQFAVVRGTVSVLATRFDGQEGHPRAMSYQPHTVYVLTADIGGNVRGVQGRAAFGASTHHGSHAVAVSVAAHDVLEPIPTLILNTDVHPDFVGKPISVSFANLEPLVTSCLYIDNVVLRAFPSAP